jgi:FtsH-binding integral membrane protein
MSRDAITRLIASVFVLLSIGLAVWFEQRVSPFGMSGSAQLWTMAAFGAIFGGSFSFLSGGYDAIRRSKATFQASFVWVWRWRDAGSNP